MKLESSVIFGNSAKKQDSRSLARFVNSASAAVGLEGSVNVLVANRSRIRQLNFRYRGKNAATDVLSFPAGVSGNGCAGDIAICRDIAVANARARSHSLDDEIRILILHGILHLAGYDHENDQGQMQRKEQALRKKFGLPTALIERSLDTPSAKLLKSSHSGQRPATKDQRRQRT